jgi:sigma-E factor negative regulatory protein RseC
VSLACIEEQSVEEQGIIKEVQDSRALVEVKRSALCDGCQAKGVCHLSSDEGIRLVWAENSVSASAGERVVLSLDDLRVLKGSFIFYLIPVFFLFLGAGLGKWLSKMKTLVSAAERLIGSVLAKFLTSADNLSIIVGVIFLILSFFGIWVYSRSAAGRGEFRPRIIRILNEPSGPGRDE